MQLNRKSLLTVEDKDQLSELIAQRIQETQTEGELYKLADKIIKFYTGTFKRTQDSYRQNANSAYYNIRFSANTANPQYLSLARKKTSQKYISDLHILQGYIQEFMAEFIGRDVTQYAIYYTDDQGNTYRKEYTSDEEKQLYNKKRAQSLSLSANEKERIKQEIKDAEQQIQFSEHYSRYLTQLTAVYEEVKADPQLNYMVARQKFNAGIQSEAFERHFQSIHQGKIETISSHSFSHQQLKEELLLSFGYTPWWVSGDVGKYQVKSFVQGQSESLKGGSVRSLEELLNFINLIHSRQLYSSVENSRIAKTVVRGLLDVQFDKTLETAVTNMLNNLDKT